MIMKLHICSILALVVGCVSSIITEYKILQENGDLSDLDILQCQLRANGNTSCAVRFITTNGILEEQDRCEQLNVDWCNTGVLESGYTYLRKSAVFHRPPYTLINYTGAKSSWEISEDIPIAIKRGAQLTVQFTAPVEMWSWIRMNFRNATGGTIYEQFLYPDDPVSSGVKSQVTAEFEDTEIRLNVQGQIHLSGNIGTVADIRILQFVFFDNPGDIHLVSFKAAIL